MTPWSGCVHTKVGGGSEMKSRMKYTYIIYTQYQIQDTVYKQIENLFSKLGT